MSSTAAPADLRQIAERVAESARKYGANHARVRVERERYVYLVRSGGTLERIDESSSLKLTTHLFVDGRYSSHSTSDLRPVALEAFLSRGVTLTRTLGEDEARALPDARLYPGEQPLRLDQMDPELGALDTPRRLAMVEALEKGVPASSHTVNLVEASYFDVANEVALVNSNGFVGEERSSLVSASVDVTTQDAVGGRSRGYEGAQVTRLAALPPLAELANRALERSVRALGGKPIQTETLPMVVENRVASRLLGSLVSALSGQWLYRKQSFLEGKLGQRIGSDLLTLVDDPALAGALGTRRFDGEGIPTQRRLLFEAGMPRNYLLDVYSANKLKLEPTSGGTSNVTMPAGTGSLEQLMARAGRGILVDAFLGGNSNSVTGDFSFGISGLYFENGQVVKPVAEMNIAGNHLEFWKQLVEVGTDPFVYSSYRLPSLRFDAVQFSGL